MISGGKTKGAVGVVGMTDTEKLMGDWKMLWLPSRSSYKYGIPMFYEKSHGGGRWHADTTFEFIPIKK